MVYRTTAMTLYVGDYKREKKAGFTKWGKVVCHVSPVNAQGKTVASISASVEFWPADQAVPGLLAEAKASAEEIDCGKQSYETFVFKGERIPDDYRDAFSFMGELTWEFIHFGEPMVKVRRNENEQKIELVKDEFGRPVICEGQTLAYWTGPNIGSGLQLSREYRLARMLRDWMALSAIPTESSSESTEEDGSDRLQGES